jgi:hypothetical protein
MASLPADRLLLRSGRIQLLGHLARWLEGKAPQEDSPEHDFYALTMIWLAQSKTIMRMAVEFMGLRTQDRYS